MSELFFHAYEAETQIQLSPPPTLAHWYLPADATLRLPWCIWTCCSLVASPYVMRTKRVLCFNASNFFKAHWSWKKSTSKFFRLLMNTTALLVSIWVHILQVYVQYGCQYILLVGGMHSRVPARTALCQLRPFPLLIILMINTSLKPRSHISILLHTCISRKHLFSLSISHLNNSPW